jgi:anthranilate synthase component II
MRLLLIDNYDSYTYNIVNCLKQIGIDNIELQYNDIATPAIANTFDGIIISPGPAVPAASGNILSIIKNLDKAIPLLGICLGHQAIAEAFGGELYRMPKQYHGVATNLVTRKEDLILQNISQDATFGLYHSWAVQMERFPDDLSATSFSTDGILMSCRHKVLPIHGVQFHPESYLSKEGMKIFSNFVGLVKNTRAVK